MFFLAELPTRDMIEGYADRHAPGQGQAIKDALVLMRRASALIRELDAYFAGHGLSQLRFLTLIVIDREPDRDWLSFSEVAARLDVSRPVISRTVRALVGDGLLQERPDADDKRARRLSLTPKAARALEALLPGYFSIIASQSQAR
ncbi:MAG: MarR family transcriptional regulator [Pseudomonadota bacterium]